MSNFRLQYSSVPLEENTDNARQTAWHRDLAGTQHWYKSPAHFTGTLRGEGRSKIVRHSEEDTCHIFRLHFIIGLNDRFKQLTRSLQDKVRLICGDCGCTTNSTDWHGLLLGPHPCPLSLLRGGGEGGG